MDLQNIQTFMHVVYKVHQSFMNEQHAKWLHKTERANNETFQGKRLQCLH